jgi:hypothetical protein
LRASTRGVDWSNRSDRRVNWLDGGGAEERVDDARQGRGRLRPLQIVVSGKTINEASGMRPAKERLLAMGATRSWIPHTTRVVATMAPRNGMLVQAEIASVRHIADVAWERLNLDAMPSPSSVLQLLRVAPAPHEVATSTRRRTLDGY